jgi:hypothetical protein
MTRSLPLAALCAAVLLLVLAAAPASAGTIPVTSCPTFRVVHNGGPSGFRAGVYDMQTWGKVTCQQAVKIFQNYLVNPRNLPSGWKADQTQAAFNKGNPTGFSLTLTRRHRTPTPSGNPVTNCPTFRVLGPDPAAGFAAGTYEMQVWGSTTCRQASSIFRSYLADPKTGLPAGWKVSSTPPSFRNGPNGFSVFQP